VLTITTADEAATYRSPLIAHDLLFPPNMAFAVRLPERVGWLDEHPSLATAGEDNEWRTARYAQESRSSMTRP
jgi:hypothetical protein